MGCLPNGFCVDFCFIDDEDVGVPASNTGFVRGSEIIVDNFAQSFEGRQIDVGANGFGVQKDEFHIGPPCDLFLSL